MPILNFTYPLKCLRVPLVEYHWDSLFFLFPLCSSEVLRQNFKRGKDHFLPDTFQFIRVFDIHHPIGLITTHAVDKASLNKPRSRSRRISPFKAVFFLFGNHWALQNEVKPMNIEVYTQLDKCLFNHITEVPPPSRKFRKSVQAK
jgi:hypothetical protein